MDPVDLDVIRSAARWLEAGRGAALVTVMRTWGSSPRPPGAMMAIRDDAQVAGSVSGGCIEDDLIDKVMKGGIAGLVQGPAPKVVTYGVATEDAQRFGLPCGGTLQLAIEPLSAASAMPALLDRLATRQLVARHLDLRTGVVTLSQAAPDQGLSFDDLQLTNVLGAGWRLIVIGAGQLSRYLCQTAVGLGFDVTVCDPREEYAQSWAIEGVTLVQGEMPDDLVQRLKPDARTALVALTHDPKLDDLALMEALRSPAFYVGALGSRANQAKRRARFIEHFDFEASLLDRLKGPAGLYIGSRTPPEIALSILVEIIAVKNGVVLPREATVGGAKEAGSSATAASAGCGVPVVRA